MSSGSRHDPIGQPHDFQTLYVQGGACLLTPRSGPAMPTILQHCALEDLACQDDDANNLVSRFRSSRQLLQDGPSAVGYECLDKVPDIAIGRCRASPLHDGAFACSSSRQACLTNNRDFVPASAVPAGECTVAADRHPGRVRDRAVYGECARVGTSTASAPNHLLIGCYWSVQDCNEAEFGSFLNGPDGVEWQRERTSFAADQAAAAYGGSPDKSSKDGWNEECTCEYVTTGACQDNTGAYQCAVSQHGCDDEEGYFISAYHLPDSIRCRLCQPDGVPQEPAPVLADLTGYPTAAPVVPDTEAPAADPTRDTVATAAPDAVSGNDGATTSAPSPGGMRGNPETSLSDGESDNGDPAAVVLSIVAATLLLTVVIAVAAFVWRRRRARARRNRDPQDSVAASTSTTAFPEESQAQQEQGQGTTTTGVAVVEDDGENHMVEAGVFG